MKFKTLFPLALATVIAPLCAQEPALKETKDKVGYSIGIDIGSNLRRSLDSSSFNFESFVAGLRDSFTGQAPKLSAEEQRAVLMAFQQEMMAKMTQQKKAQGDQAKKQGEEYLAANKAKAGVVTTASGLQYKVVNEGQGASPKASDEVTVHYTGTLVDGTKFDSSVDRGQPASFPVDGVIAGWTEALQLMKPGAKWQLVIPSNLAYGENGAGNEIPPNATLLFDVELLSVKAGKAPEAAQVEVPPQPAGPK